MRTLKFPTAVASAFLASAVVGALTLAGPAPIAVESHGHHSAEAHASWANGAETVIDLVRDSAIVVRAQAVDRGETRSFWQPAPNGAQRAPFVFTDTEIEVLEVFRGDVEVGDRLQVMQTGGEYTLKNGTVNLVEMNDDPIYRFGDEMVLFLADISGDSVHAADRQLFRTVNPMGRFQVQGTTVQRPGHRTQLKGAERVADLGSLSAEIQAAVSEIDALESER
ncbi:MAG: hypothetical protein AAGE94_14770 [Acidobacteriota bacterium]